MPAGEEEWQTHSEHTVTPDTSVVSHLGTLKAWTYEVPGNTWSSAAASLGAGIASQGSQAQGSIQEFRIEVSKLHVDVGF